MLPLVPFIAGVLTGVAAVRILRNRTARQKLDRAQEKLSEGASRVARKAKSSTVAGLRSVEKTAMAMRNRLDEQELVDTVEQTVDEVVEVAQDMKHARPGRSKAATTRNTARGTRQTSAKAARKSARKSTKADRTGSSGEPVNEAQATSRPESSATTPDQ